MNVSSGSHAKNVSRANSGKSSSGIRSNLILKPLAQDLLSAVEQKGQRTQFCKNEIVCHTGDPITAVYFPETVILSIARPLASGSMTEIGTMGCDGILGMELVLGETVSSISARCQIEGWALKLDKDDFLVLLESFPHLRTACQRSILRLVDLLAINRVCSLNHTVKQRCALWLLVTSLRRNSEQFFLTQDFLASNLGISRTRVSIAISSLTAAGILSISRGKLAIVDRGSLEQSACECLKTIGQFFE